MIEFEEFLCRTGELTSVIKLIKTPEKCNSEDLKVEDYGYLQDIFLDGQGSELNIEEFHNMINGDYIIPSKEEIAKHYRRVMYVGESKKCYGGLANL